MRHLLQFLVLALCLVFSNGCMVLDEVDKANAKMTKRKAPPKTEATTNAAVAAVAAKDNPLLKQSKEWWGRATSLAPTGIDSTIVKCQLGSTTQFMSKNDCLSRGGTPQGLSG